MSRTGKQDNFSCLKDCLLSHFSAKSTPPLHLQRKHNALRYQAMPSVQVLLSNNAQLTCCTRRQRG